MEVFKFPILPRPTYYFHLLQIGYNWIYQSYLVFGLNISRTQIVS
jgi:hypothetical protein